MSNREKQTTNGESGTALVQRARLCRFLRMLCNRTRSLCQSLCRVWRCVSEKILLPALKRLVLPVVAVLVLLGILLGVSALLIRAAVCDKTEDRILSADALADMDGEFDCILVLGCRVYPDGEPSAMLYDRIKTGCELYALGISDRILMSGDNQEFNYNEVDPMRREAVAMGVPEEAIMIDRYGLSTYDSVVRLLEEFECRRVVIVTQSYHLYRTLYIAEKLGIDAYGVSADLRPYYGQAGRDLREILASCKDVVYAHKRLPTARQMQQARGLG